VPDKLKTVFFITEGGTNIGLGHLMRSVAVAQSLDRKRKAVFIVNRDKTVLRILKKYKFPSAHKLDRVKNGPVLIDLRKCPSRLVARLQKNGCKVTLLDSLVDARLLADKNIYFDPKGLDWKNKKGKVYCGIEYFPLRKDLKGIRRRKSKTGNHILLAFGGADPNQLTLQTLKALKDEKAPVHIKALIGPAFREGDKRRIRRLAKSFPHKIRLIENSSDPRKLVKETDVCMTALGVSIYEFNHFGVPVLMIQNYRNDAKAAGHLERLKVATSLGYYKNVKAASIRKAVHDFIDGGAAGNVHRRVDGRGAERVGRLLC
jgi:spore coat polysaccharide biosynthesis predicted glycosyltransferase SpsG